MTTPTTILLYTLLFIYILEGTKNFLKSFAFDLQVLFIFSKNQNGHFTMTEFGLKIVSFYARQREYIY